MDIYIRSYGVAALFDRVLTASEILKMTAAREVYRAFTSRKASTNWVEWAEQNKKSAELLASVERLLNG